MRRPYLALRGSRAVATAACAFLAALAGPAANAAIVAPSQCVRGSESVTCTLEQLYQPGAAVTVDLIQFRNWHFIESDDALDAVAPGDVSIVFSESGRRINLDFVSDAFHGDPWEGNYVFAYDVRVPVDLAPDRIDKADLSLIDYRIGPGPADVKVDACFDPVDVCSKEPSLSVFANTFGGGDEETFQSLVFSPARSAFPVVTHIGLSGSSEINGEPGGIAQIDRFRESFYRVPEPGTIALVVLPAAVLLARRRNAARASV